MAQALLLSTCGIHKRAAPEPQHDWRLMRPRLHPHVPLVWRDKTTLQIGVAPAASALIDDADVVLLRFLQDLDGRLTIEQLRQLPNCPSPRRLKHALAALAQAHGLIDAEIELASQTRAPRSLRERTLNQSLTQQLTRAEPDGGALVMSAIKKAYVFVHGANPLAFAITHLLAAGGVGRIVIDSPQHLAVKVRPETIIGLGPQWCHLGEPGILVSREIAKSFGAEISRPKGLHQPDFEIFTQWPDTNQRDRVSAEQIDHVLAITSGGFASVGPLVLPGKSPCLRCIELAQQRHDPQWVYTRFQLRDHQTRIDQCWDSLTTTWAAATTCMGVLFHLARLQGDPTSSLVGQRLVASSLGPQISVEQFGLDPTCGCV